jgi:hypothetical protein
MVTDECHRVQWKSCQIQSDFPECHQKAKSVIEYSRRHSPIVAKRKKPAIQRMSLEDCDAELRSLPAELTNAVPARSALDIEMIEETYCARHAYRKMLVQNGAILGIVAVYS